MTPRPHAVHGVPNEEVFGVSQAISAGGFIYVAGQIAREPDGSPIGEPGLEANVAKAVHNMRVLLERLGSRLDRVLQATAFVVPHPEKHRDELLPLLRDHFVGAQPALSVVGVAGLYHPAYLIEISAIALAGGGDEVTPRRVAAVSPVEKELACSQAVAAAGHLFVSGQMALDAAGDVLAEGNVVGQFSIALSRVIDAVRAAGGKADDVVATHIFMASVPTPDEFRLIGETHRTVFTGDNRPTATMIVVSGFPVAGALVSISGTAVVSPNHSKQERHT